MFCLDNDKIGWTRADTMAKECTKQGYRVRLALPILKDYNEDLLHYHQAMELLEQKRISNHHER